MHFAILGTLGMYLYINKFFRMFLSMHWDLTKNVVQPGVFFPPAVKYKACRTKQGHFHFLAFTALFLRSWPGSWFRLDY